MDTPYLYTDYAQMLRRAFPFKVQKISVDGGFGCPNRDGLKGWGGCTYCNNQAFNPSYCNREKSVTRQLEEGKLFFARKCTGVKYLAYFQAYTNTYGTVDRVARMFEEALGVADVVGLVVGTRPDCMPQALLDYLAELNRRTFLVVEYGIESANDSTLERINRGHTFAETAEAVCRTAAAGIRTGGHVILGLPGEDHDELMRQAVKVSRLPLDTLKIHQLQLIRGTRMAREFARHPHDFHFLSVDDYVDLVIDYIERLPTGLALERFVSQSPHGMVIAPRWGLKSHEFAARLLRRMEERGACQGRLAER